MPLRPFKPRPFPPKRINERRLATALQKAEKALAEYNQVLARIPDPRLLFSLRVLEAAASVESQKKEIPLKEIFLSPPQAIQQCVDALVWGCAYIEHTSITKKFICTLHKKIKQNTGSATGAYRTKQNWIGPAGCTMGKAYFYPPAPEHVDPMMRELIRFGKRKEKQPLLQLALLFAQLLIIHPFMDGNGRVARTLVPLFLYEKNRIVHPTLFLSPYFKRHRLRYFQTLFQTTEENQWDAWILFFLKGIQSEAKKSFRQLKKIIALYKKMRGKNISQRALLTLFEKPLFSLDEFKKAGGRNMETLQKLGWVRQEKRGTFLFVPMWEILGNK